MADSDGSLFDSALLDDTTSVSVLDHAEDDGTGNERPGEGDADSISGLSALADSGTGVAEGSVESQGRREGLTAGSSSLGSGDALDGREASPGEVDPSVPTSPRSTVRSRQASVSGDVESGSGKVDVTGATGAAGATGGGARWLDEESSVVSDSPPTAAVSDPRVSLKVGGGSGGGGGYLGAFDSQSSAGDSSLASSLVASVTRRYPRGTPIAASGSDVAAADPFGTDPDASGRYTLTSKHDAFSEMDPKVAQACVILGIDPRGEWQVKRLMKYAHQLAQSALFPWRFDEDTRVFINSRTEERSETHRTVELYATEVRKRRERHTSREQRGCTLSGSTTNSSGSGESHAGGGEPGRPAAGVLSSSTGTDFSSVSQRGQKHPQLAAAGTGPGEGAGGRGDGGGVVAGGVVSDISGFDDSMFDDTTFQAANVEPEPAADKVAADNGAAGSDTESGFTSFSNLSDLLQSGSGGAAGGGGVTSSSSSSSAATETAGRILDDMGPSMLEGGSTAGGALARPSGAAAAAAAAAGRPLPLKASGRSGMSGVSASPSSASSASSAAAASSTSPSSSSSSPGRGHQVRAKSTGTVHQTGAGTGGARRGTSHLSPASSSASSGASSGSPGGVGISTVVRGNVVGSGRLPPSPSNVSGRVASRPIRGGGSSPVHYADVASDGGVMHASDLVGSVGTTRQTDQQLQQIRLETQAEMRQLEVRVATLEDALAAARAETGTYRHEAETLRTTLHEAQSSIAEERARWQHEQKRTLGDRVESMVRDHQRALTALHTESGEEARTLREETTTLNRALQRTERDGAQQVAVIRAAHARDMEEVQAAHCSALEMARRNGREEVSGELYSLKARLAQQDRTHAAEIMELQQRHTQSIQGAEQDVATARVVAVEVEALRERMGTLQLMSRDVDVERRTVLDKREKAVAERERILDAERMRLQQREDETESLQARLQEELHDLASREEAHSKELQRDHSRLAGSRSVWDTERRDHRSEVEQLRQNIERDREALRNEARLFEEAKTATLNDERALSRRVAADEARLEALSREIDARLANVTEREGVGERDRAAFVAEYDTFWTQRHNFHSEALKLTDVSIRVQQQAERTSAERGRIQQERERRDNDVVAACREVEEHSRQLRVLQEEISGLEEQRRQLKGQVLLETKRNHRKSARSGAGVVPDPNVLDELNAVNRSMDDDGHSKRGGASYISGRVRPGTACSTRAVLDSDTQGRLRLYDALYGGRGGRVMTGGRGMSGTGTRQRPQQTGHMGADMQLLSGLDYLVRSSLGFHSGNAAAGSRVVGMGGSQTVDDAVLDSARRFLHSGDGNAPLAATKIVMGASAPAQSRVAAQLEVSSVVAAPSAKEVPRQEDHGSSGLYHSSQKSYTASSGRACDGGLLCASPRTDSASQGNGIVVANRASMQPYGRQAVPPDASLDVAEATAATLMRLQLQRQPQNLGTPVDRSSSSPPMLPVEQSAGLRDDGFGGGLHSSGVTMSGLSSLSRSSGGDEDSSLRFASMDQTLAGATATHAESGNGQTAALHPVDSRGGHDPTVTGMSTSMGSELTMDPTLHSYIKSPSGWPSGGVVGAI